MGNYMVYTRIRVNDEVKEIMVANIESTSCGGAEHRILDVHNSIDNALAFDVENLSDTFMAYIRTSKVMSYETFKRNYLNMVKIRQSNIDRFLDEVNEISNENKEVEELIKDYESKIARLKNTIAVNNRCIEDLMKECADYCAKVKMPLVHSEEEYVIGIA